MILIVIFHNGVIIVPCLNKVEEGEYWTTLCLSVCLSGCTHVRVGDKSPESVCLSMRLVGCLLTNLGQN